MLGAWLSEISTARPERPPPPPLPHVSAGVSVSVDAKTAEKRRPPPPPPHHPHRAVLRSPGNSHTPTRPPQTPSPPLSSSSSSACAGAAVSPSMAGVYSLRSPTPSALLPSLQALPPAGLLSKLGPRLLQGPPPANNSPATETKD